MPTIPRSLLALLCLALLPLPSVGLAGIIFVPVNGFVTVPAGSDIRIQHTPTGLYKVTTTGLVSSATIDCSGNIQCRDAELDGKIMEIDEDFRLVIDRAEGTVTGVFRGIIFVPVGGQITLPVSARYRGEVEGRFDCRTGGDQGCTTASVSLNAVAPLRDGETDTLIGSVTWQIEGAFERFDAESGEWQSFNSEGGLTIVLDE
jgi:hypothetical protein